jgi:hypothetical protein
MKESDIEMRDPKVKGYLITESAVTTEKPTIIESGKDSVKIQASLQDADTPNRNRRSYGEDVLREAVANPYIQERLKTKSFYGEAGKFALYIGNGISKLLFMQGALLNR